MIFHTPLPLLICIYACFLCHLITVCPYVSLCHLIYHRDLMGQCASYYTLRQMSRNAFLLCHFIHCKHAWLLCHVSIHVCSCQIFLHSHLPSNLLFQCSAPIDLQSAGLQLRYYYLLTNNQLLCQSLKLLQ